MKDRETETGDSTKGKRREILNIRQGILNAERERQGILKAREGRY